MTYKNVLMFILRCLCGAALVLLIWNPLVNIVFAFAQGPDPLFDLGNGYKMWYRPPPGSSGGIVYWPSKDEPFEHIISKTVLEFALSGPWIIGTTENGWFGIHKESHQIHYPCSKEQLQSITALEISSIDMETDPMPYLIVRPKAVAAKDKARRICWILLFVVPLVFGFAPIIVKRNRKSIKKEQKGELPDG